MIKEELNMKIQYTEPSLKFEELSKFDILLTRETNPTTAEGQIINDGPPETIDFG